MEKSGKILALAFVALLAFAGGRNESAPALAATLSEADTGSGTAAAPTGSVTNSIGGEDKGRNYDETVRQEAQLPRDWFTCASTEDCALIPVPCNTSFAANRAHREDSAAAYCRSHETCVDYGQTAAFTCRIYQPEKSQAVCERGECRTFIAP